MKRFSSSRQALAEFGKRLRSHGMLVATRLFIAFFVVCFSSQAAQPPWLGAFDAQPVDGKTIALHLTNGTILTPQAEAALFAKHATSIASLSAQRPFNSASSEPPTIVLKKKSPKLVKSWKDLPYEDKATLLGRLKLAGVEPPSQPPPKPPFTPGGKPKPPHTDPLMGVPPHPGPGPTPLASPESWEIRFYGPDGAIDTEQSISFKSTDYTALRSSVEARAPNGGLIYLGGEGTLSFNDGMAPLRGKSLDECDGKLCLTDDKGKLYVPVAIDGLFAEVWDRVYAGDVDSFYLSIDPTDKMLRANAPQPPSNLTTTGARNFRVVTQGGIERSEIGKVMFDADVFFKSADLGFDVGVGPRASLIKHGFDGRAYSIKGASAELQSASHNWCRFYWASGRQTMSVSGDSVKFVGAPVIAKAEAMHVVDGELEPYPQGTWCSDGQVIAGILNRHAASPAKAPLEVQRLVKLGQLRNLLVGAKRAGVTATDKLKDKVSAARSTTAYRVPEWSSGVFFAPPAQLTVTPGPVIHIYSIDEDGANRAVSDVEKPAADHWDEMLRNNGFELKGTYWEKDSPTNKQEFLRIARDAANWKAEQVAKRLSGTVKQPGSWQPPEDRLRPGETAYAGISNVSWHGLPTVVEGGLLLQTLRPDAREVVESPSGHPVFRREGNTLHFWVLNGGSQTKIEYLRLEDAKVADVSASDGVLRYYVSGSSKPITALHQVRFSTKAEWSRNFLLSKNPGQPDYGFMFNGTQLLRSRPGFVLEGSELAQDLHLVVRQVADDRWLVEVPVPDASQGLAEAWTKIQKSKSIGDGIEHLTELRHFGFDRFAEERGEEMSKWLDEGTNDDRTHDNVLLALLLQGSSLWADPSVRLDLACALSSSRTAEAALRRPKPGPAFDKAMLALANEYEPKKRLLLFDSLERLSMSHTYNADNTWQGKLWEQEAQRFSKLSAQLRPLVAGSNSPVL